MVSPKLLKTTLSNYYLGDGAYVPSPGEVIVISLDDVNKQIVKVGDGKRTIQELPEIQEMKIEYEFGAPWINRMVGHIPEEVWKRAEENIKKKRKVGSWHITTIIEEAVRILSEEYYNL